MAKLRLGLEDLLIARPLTWAILKGEHSEVFDTTTLPHRRVAPLLSEGALDVGLVAAAELEEFEFAAIPDLGVVLVAGGGAARVEWRTPEGHARSVAIDDVCPGTTARAVEWLESRFEKRFSEAKWESADVRVRTALRGQHADEAGDDGDFAGLFEREFSFEPLLYVWACRHNTELREAEFALKSSLRFGLGSLPALCREVASESRELARDHGPDSEEVERLFQQGVRYVR